MTEFGAFLKEEAFWTCLREWWEGLAQNRGPRAELRRARTPFDVLTSKAFQRNLVPRLQGKNISLTGAEQERLALPVGVLAHVRQLEAKRFMPVMLADMQKANSDVTDRRVKRLLAVTDRDELFTALIRLVRFMDNTAHLRNLVESGFWWTDATRKNWALNYYLNPEQR
ncbi:CRISPR-associated protein, Cse2 family [Oleidesulfovibrio alaskensis G20]|uniref:CRISPR-associated protein, Cse2 family n=1 Tax=Oleidesulfovibrio alaskensis (strain ATCC BAA-1058 / DSM 17464 / G20) TaxID=207559 RepID=Q314I2_OLEA2|nr:type I-E CRISPR-associated protein Cse2/CasB [Oleidesulfovibrio alaskensis]ABB37664.1 CRISPR-associated protein, Cse2 family [Oleidesulfovibrio alaskensis G20]